jgi:hypothetical protein
MTLVSIGYGDITPTNMTEYVWSSVLMCLSGCAWAYIIGNACRVFNSLDRNASEFRNKIDTLNHFLEE